MKDSQPLQIWINGGTKTKTTTLLERSTWRHMTWPTWTKSGTKICISLERIFGCFHSFLKIQSFVFRCLYRERTSSIECQNWVESEKWRYVEFYISMFSIVYLSTFIVSLYFRKRIYACQLCWSFVSYLVTPSAKFRKRRIEWNNVTKNATDRILVIFLSKLK